MMTTLKLFILLILLSSCGNIPKLREAVEEREILAQAKKTSDSSRSTAATEDGDLFEEELNEEDEEDLALLEEFKEEQVIEAPVAKAKIAPKAIVLAPTKVDKLELIIKQRKKMGIYIPSKVGVSSLLVAAQKATPETIRALVKHKNIDIDSQSQFTGKTALIVATQAKRRDNIRAILKLNGDPKIRDNKNKSALDYAQENGLLPLFD